MFDPPVLLAPMDGVTDAVFRDQVAALGGVGALVTEFIRISAAPVPTKVFRRHLGTPTHRVPVAVQLMAAAPEHVAESAAAAQAAGAAWIDLNFGCPAPVVFGKCAGSALLCHPERIAAIVRAAVSGTSLPVSAKLRVGIADDSPLERNLLEAADAGAAMITLHARRRIDPYTAPAHWPWMERAVRILRTHGHRIPLVGNGSVETPDDIARMRVETGCDAVMVGRAALADPFLFRVAAGGHPADAAEALAFVRAYAAAMPYPLPKLKQLITWYRAGGLFAGCEDRRRPLLRVATAAELLDGLAELAAQGTSMVGPLGARTSSSA